MMAFFSRGFIDAQFSQHARVIGCSGLANPVIKDPPDALWIDLQYLGDSIDRHFLLDQG